MSPGGLNGECDLTLPSVTSCECLEYDCRFSTLTNYLDKYLMRYADDITITSTHTSMSAARKYIQPYLHKVYDWTQHNNLIIKLINPDKTTCTLFTPDPAEYNSNLGLNINNKALPMALHPKVLGLTLDPKLTYNAHIQNIATHAQKPLQVIKALTGTT